MHLKTLVLLGSSFTLTCSPDLQAQRARANVAAPVAPHSFTNAPNSNTNAPNSNLGGRPFQYRGSVAPPTGLISPAASYSGIAPGALRSRQSVGRYRNSGYGYGAVGIPFLPYFDTGSYSGFPSYSEQAQAMGGLGDADMAQAAMAQQLDELSAELYQLRGKQRDANSYQWQSGAAPGPGVAEQQPPQAPIILILQDGSKVSSGSYAVMNNVIWDFSKQPTKKIPVASVDIAASEKATQQNGGEFPSLSLAH